MLLFNDRAGRQPTPLGLSSHSINRSKSTSFIIPLLLHGVVGPVLDVRPEKVGQNSSMCWFYSIDGIVRSRINPKIPPGTEENRWNSIKSPPGLVRRAGAPNT